jgi:hypothetical protein
MAAAKKKVAKEPTPRHKHRWDKDMIQELVSRVSTAPRGAANDVYREFADRIGGGMRIEAVRQQYYLNRDEQAVKNKAKVQAQSLQLREARRLQQRATGIKQRIATLEKKHREMERQIKKITGK